MSDPAQKSPEPQPAPPGRAARRERYLACLAELSTRLLRAPDPLVVLDLAVGSLRAASGADRSYVFENHARERGAVCTTLRAEACSPEVEAMLGRPETIGAPLVILDLDMPGMDGRACLGALRAVEPEIKVVISTGLPASELGDALGGGTLLLPKPYELLQLSDTVAAAIGEREPEE